MADAAHPGNGWTSEHIGTYRRCTGRNLRGAIGAAGETRPGESGPAMATWT
jgi:hypothetical protein